MIFWVGFFPPFAQKQTRRRIFASYKQTTAAFRGFNARHGPAPGGGKGRFNTRAFPARQKKKSKRLFDDLLLKL